MRAYCSFGVIQLSTPSKTTLGKQSKLRDDKFVDLYELAIVHIRGLFKKKCTSLGTRCIVEYQSRLIACQHVF